jgi:hypothetical protein
MVPAGEIDIWWLFRWELSVKPSKVAEAAKQLSEAVGNVYDQSPDEELSKIKNNSRTTSRRAEFEEVSGALRENAGTVRDGPRDARQNLLDVRPSIVQGSAEAR